MRVTHTFFFALLGLAACAKPESPPQTTARMTAEAATARAAIEATNARWMAHLTAGHPDSVAALYASNARMMGNGTPTVTGRAAIAQEFGQMTKMGAWTITLHSDSVWANGPLVLETGTWTSTFKPAPGAPPMDTTDSGKYMVRWTQENGQWLIADDIFNSDKMPTPPPAAPASRRKD
jgi:ketosteroid isomerase-like protein